MAFEVRQSDGSNSPRPSPQKRRYRVPSKDSRAVTHPLLATQPIIQIRDAKTPVFIDVTARDLTKAGLLLECVRVHAQKSRRLDRIQQRFEFDNREAAPSRNLC